MFTHVHYVNGVMIAHSHPYKDAHSHSKSNIVVIAHFASYHSLEAETSACLTPERFVLFTAQVPESIPVAVATHLRVLSLRAPPVVLFG